MTAGQQNFRQREKQQGFIPLKGPQQLLTVKTEVVDAIAGLWMEDVPEIGRHKPEKIETVQTILITDFIVLGVSFITWFIRNCVTA